MLPMQKLRKELKKQQPGHRDFAQALAAEKVVSQEAKSELGKVEARISQQDSSLHTLKSALRDEREQNQSLNRDVFTLMTPLHDARLSQSVHGYFQMKRQQQPQSQPQQPHPYQ